MATIKIILDSRRLKQKTKTYPVKLQVIFNRTTRHYPTIFDLSTDDYNKLRAPRINERSQEVREKLNFLKRNAVEFVRQMDEFNFYEFEHDFVNEQSSLKPKKNLAPPATETVIDGFDYSPYLKRFIIFQEEHSVPGTISGVYLSYIKLLLQEGRIGSAIQYKDSYSSLKKFRGNVKFTDISTGYLYQYENWMLERGNSKTTVGIKLRALRCIFNEAIHMGIIKKEKHYPFGRRKYRIPTSRNLKKALTQDELRKIYYDVPACMEECKAKDFWLFLYLANGMNPKDLCHLKYKDMQEGYLTFIRAKTERATRSDPRPITIFLSEDMLQIIGRWGTPDKNPDNYIFPVLLKNTDAMKQYSRVPLFTRFINDYMAKVGQRLGIEKKITTIVSRHSFSTQLKWSGASTEYIQEALGHTDKRTTENYLDSFGRELKKDFSQKLLSFKY
ncbi:MAG: site-specific integrase [Bacteroidota bacterium]